MSKYREKIKKLFENIFSHNHHNESIEIILSRETWYYAGKSSVSCTVSSFLNKIKEGTIKIKNEDDFHERLIKILDIDKCDKCDRYDVIRFMQADSQTHICKDKGDTDGS